ncbi:MAG TPA: kelch repeat-containing protein [Solirubrobacterales bacterium]|nr:kelch repeat-containing protein [Solirubrobacterales bacterium]
MKLLGALLAVMATLFVVAVLAYADVVDLPGSWRTELGFQEATPDPPCRLGMYRKSPATPPPLPGHWQDDPETPHSQVEGSAATIGPKIYVTGGARPGNLHRVLVFDTRDHRWTQPAQLPVGLNHSPSAVHDGKLYLAGGFLEGEAETNRFFQFDPAKNQWSELPPMKQARGGGGAVVIGDKLYVVDGGAQPYNVDVAKAPKPVMEVFDFKTRTWSPATPPPLGVHHVGVALLDGKIYMAGGRLVEEQSSDEFVRYDPATDRWTRLPDLPLGPTSSLVAVAADGKIVVLGGDDEAGWEDGGGWVTPTAWAFDPHTGRWKRLPDMDVERHAFAAATDDGRIYAIGGSICPGLKPNGPVTTSTVESLPVSAVGHG